jgi:hypothetical protein
MTPYELLDLALSLSNRIDNHWTLFISVHLALIGGIVYVDRPLFRNEKIAAIIIYSGFALVNFYMMKNQALFLGSIYQQVFQMKDQACCLDNRVIAYVVGLHEWNSSAKTLTSIMVTHIVMYIILMLSIFYDRALPKNKNNKKPMKIK